MNPQVDFSQDTKNAVAKKAGVRCSNPTCRKLTTGPDIKSSRITTVGVGAPITAMAAGGPRFNAKLSPEERQSPQNCIWLCQNCARLISSNIQYSAEIFQAWKTHAETPLTSDLQQENATDVEISYETIALQPNKHDYRLFVKLRNLGAGTLGPYTVDLEMPARVMERPDQNALYVPARSNATTSVFYISNEQLIAQLKEEITPGNTKVAITITYFVTAEIYRSRGNLFSQPVKATFSRQGFQPVVVEKKLTDFQEF